MSIYIVYAMIAYSIYVDLNFMIMPLGYKKWMDQVPEVVGMLI